VEAQEEKDSAKGQLVKFAVVAVILLTTGVLSSKEPGDWKQGKLINVDVGSYTKTTSSPYINNGQVFTHRRRVFTYSIDAGDKIYQAETDIAPTAISVDVNGPVEFRIDKDHLYIKGPDGKSHKFDLVKTTRKE
jgi:hypothetical protein